MRIGRRLRRIMTLAIAVACLPASAEDLQGKRLTFGGFGTIAGVYHDQEGIEYRRAVNQSRGAEAGEVDFATDSLIGAQLNAAWNPRLEVVAQVISRLNADNSWQPRVSRGFLRYVPNEALMLRTGRLGYELLPRADSRDIGYSYLTIRPPIEVFGLLPKDDFDGADLTLTQPLGNGLGRLKLYGGRTGGTFVFADGSRTELNGSNIWGGHLEYLFGGWVVRAGSGIFKAKDKPAVEPLVAALRQAGTAGAVALADELVEQGRRTTFYVLGAAYEEGPLQVKLFLARADAQSAPGPKVNFATVSAGYGIGSLTPYASFSLIDSYADVRSIGLPDTPEFAPLNAAAYAIQTVQQPEQHTLSLGLRWDVAPKMDIKFQIDQVWLSRSTLVIQRDVPFKEDVEMTVLGVAFDFVF